MTEIDTLTDLYGVGSTYRDFRNELREIPLASRTAILAAMGVDASTPEAITLSIRRFERERWSHTLPPVIVVRGGAEIDVPIVIAPPAKDAASAVEFSPFKGSARSALIKVIELGKK